MSTRPSEIVSDLAPFVAAAKSKGIADDTLVSLLRQSGWSERRVYEALNAYYTGVIGVAPPKRGGGTENARDAFFYLLNFITLGMWATALGQIFYYLVDETFADPAQVVSRARFGSHAGLVVDMSWQLANILVAFPLFVFIHTLIERNLRQQPQTLDSPIRLWLTYIALVITAVIVLGDGVWFVGSFLRGQLSIAFLLHSLTLLVISGGIFIYYLNGLRRRSDDRA